ncbi:MAG: VWA domain-containing protein [Candidatus Neomarinimicrobiota bacterium]|nr:VWA domain-containing protein [Candidatus Neomarinimicrobiota bacterium]
MAWYSALLWKQNSFPRNPLPLQPAVTSRLHDAITVFGRFLRQAGCSVGTGEIMNAIKSSSHIEIINREDFRQAMKACFISDHKLLPLFDQLFDLYWRNPDRIENVSQILRKLYESRLTQAELKNIKEQGQKLIYKKVDDSQKREKDSEQEDEKTYDVFLYSPQEVLRSKRFDNYTNEELDMAQEFITRWEWRLGERRLRRLEPGRKPLRLNIRQTIRKNIFPAQDFIELHWKQKKVKPRPLVILTDISGSMETYTRILLHFMYTLNTVHKQMESFTFGTRLSRITHHLRRREVNDALELINDNVKDWSGGTKIGETLETFNRKWARRVLSGGAVVLMISDGWDTGNVELLKKETDRLHRSCHRLIWLNPNLGYEDFQPLTEGVQAILSHVDDFLPIHNLNSLMDLGNVLSRLDKRNNLKASA